MQEQFKQTVWQYFAQSGRDLPWRAPNLSLQPDGTLDPYRIMISEVMLQQTQVPRVVTKYHEFVDHFPTADALAETPFKDVLDTWMGLGYNRRARFLHEAAKAIVSEHGGHVPRHKAELASLPGIGSNTAGAIRAYAFNEPEVFIETNIRTVYLHHFFHDAADVPDSAVLPLIEGTLERSNPRGWYWALMDYGWYLKKTVTNPSRRSRHYKKQSRYEGSVRQMRAELLRRISAAEHSITQLRSATSDARFDDALQGLIKDKMVEVKDGKIRLAA